MSEIEFADLEKLEKLAMVGAEMPSGICSADQLLFLNLRALYRQFKIGGITREQGLREKNKILKEYKVACDLYESSCRWIDHLKNTELARHTYRKNRTIENADALLLAVEGSKMK